MDLPAWAQVLIVLVAVWVALVVVLVLAGRAILARELALLLPNLLRLFAGLLRDPRVPLSAKVALVLASLWLASPIDLIPEFVPIVGPLDDAIVAALTLRFVLRRTDAALLREHWPGDPLTLDRVLRLASIGGGRPRALP